MDIISIIIVIILIIYIKRGYSDGAIKITTGFVGIIIAYIISVKFYGIGYSITKSIINIPKNLTIPLGVLSTFIIILIAFHILSPIIYKKIIPKNIRKSKFNKYAGAILSLIEGIILISFMIFIITNLKLNMYGIETKIRKSTIGKIFVKENSKILSPVIGSDLNKIKLHSKIVIPSK
ncbi:CvpA family protein [Patescibacteria group bacterium]|nr:CvpA family protein [Patescibacteria group bacterium]